MFTLSIFISCVPAGTTGTAFILVATIMLFLTLLICVSVIKILILFQMVLLEWFNGDGNETHLILADLIFLKLSLLISVLWLMNDPALVPLIVFVILCLM